MTAFEALRTKVIETEYASWHLADKATVPGYIYGVQNPILYDCNRNVLKVGMAKTFNDNDNHCNRANGYHSQSRWYCVWSVSNARLAENMLLAYFDEHPNFLKYPLYGREYYEGDVQEMVREAYVLLRSSGLFSDVQIGFPTGHTVARQERAVAHTKMYVRHLHRGTLTTGMFTEPRRDLICKFVDAYMKFVPDSMYGKPILFDDVWDAFGHWCSGLNGHPSMHEDMFQELIVFHGIGQVEVEVQLPSRVTNKLALVFYEFSEIPSFEFGEF